jgi:aerobic-type carbon monoxide dehydrogenase small subunit (CoxS/CutS family)
MPEITLEVNGSQRRGQVEPRKLLSDFLRQDLGLTGTHVGCEHGVCGSCTVLIDGVATRSCLTFAVQLDGHSVETVEGLAAPGEMHPLQRSFKEHFALQCGFCTPGILIAALDFVRQNPRPTRDEIRRMLSGQLCRCTGYTSIVEAIHDYALSL